MSTENKQCIVRIFDEPQPYEPIWQAMRDHIKNKPSHDEIWLLEHHPVYTQGQAGLDEHILQRNEIPVVRSDRGGQITYHGPGQLMIYTLIDLRAAQYGIRRMVTCLEQCVIQLLEAHGVQAYAKKEAPGVYVAHKKIASLGLRVRHGYCYHGMALNIDMDLSPFQAINPCGYQNLAICQVRDHLPQLTQTSIQQFVINYLQSCFCYKKMESASIPSAQPV